jgi:acetoin utilization deacetylase AcuC-like enzyme
LVDEDYAWITQHVKNIAAKSAQGRIVSALEGGYELNALARSANAHIAALSE